MKWQSNYKHPDGYRFFIEHEVLFESMQKKYNDVYYLIGQTEDADLCNYFQEKFETAIWQAYKKFGVPEDSWVKIED